MTSSILTSSPIRSSIDFIFQGAKNQYDSMYPELLKKNEQLTAFSEHFSTREKISGKQIEKFKTALDKVKSLSKTLSHLDNAVCVLSPVSSHILLKLEEGETDGMAIHQHVVETRTQIAIMQNRLNGLFKQMSQKLALIYSFGQPQTNFLNNFYFTTKFVYRT
jgi:hypothetical protein